MRLEQRLRDRLSGPVGGRHDTTEIRVEAGQAVDVMRTLHDDPRAPSMTFLWKGAEWPEREAYDMFGIIFEGNRDLRRIYMPPDYTSFPLRKDFYLADDAARSAGEGVRYVEQMHAPAEAPDQTLVRKTRAP